MKYIYLLTAQIILLHPLHAQRKYATGLIIDTAKYKKVETISPAFKFSDIDRFSYSLKKYCPIPGDQGQLGTCTSWATGYAALTIASAIESNLTNTKAITDNVRSPLYIYNQIKANTNCEGAKTEDALKILKQKGDCYLKDFHPVNCLATPSLTEDIKAEEFKIKEYNSLFRLNANAEQKISATINSLNADKPVVISLNVLNSIFNVSNDGIYIPQGEDKGYHALCVIGYDNEKKQFEIINSWGTGWGNKGFFYMSYDSYSNYCREAFQFTLNSTNNFKEKKISGTFELLKFNGVDNASKKYKFNSITPYFSSSDNSYHLNAVIKKDDFFRLRTLNLTKDTYVYIISFKPNKTAEILFPLHYSSKNNSDVDIPLITSSNVSIELPENMENAYSADQSGNDVLCILYSKKRIENLQKNILEIKTYNGDIWKWLRNSYKDELIETSNLNYSTFDMGVNTTNSNTGSIVPLILKVNIQ